MTGLQHSGALETALSYGDETRGRIVLRGEDLASLAERCAYEEVAGLLWRDVAPGTVTAETLGAARRRAFKALAPLEGALAARPAGEAMRALVGALPAQSKEPALDLVAGVGVAAAAAVRSQASQAWIAPEPARAHAADLLAMVAGRQPDPAVARAFERYCILMIDHGISASTYAARIAAAVSAPLPGAALAALAVLQGVRHGGAPALVLAQLDEIAGPKDAPRFVAAARAAGRRIVGFGSRAYAGRDLRSELMKAQWLAIGGPSGRRAQAEAVEVALTACLADVEPSRGLKANVEYYAALLLEAVGLPRDGFTPMFAAARSAGWAAHYFEQRGDRRMIRPSSRYIGEWPASGAAQAAAGEIGGRADE